MHRGAQPNPPRPEPPQRWRAKRKAEVVLRLLRGESLDALNRRTAVPVPAVGGVVHASAQRPGAALQIRADDDPAHRRLDEANRRIGELSTEVELLRTRCEMQGPFAGRRSRT